MLVVLFIDSLSNYADFLQSICPSKYNLLYITDDISMHTEQATVARVILVWRTKRLSRSSWQACGDKLPPPLYCQAMCLPAWSTPPFACLGQEPRGVP
jgi:hypothetical protein